MPIYEYECSECGQIEEAFQKMSDPPLSKCKHCQGNLHKILSQSSFHLKGSGWYVTDYGGRKSDSSSTGKSSKKEAATSCTKKPAKTDCTSSSESASK
ncbi:MAG: zinc ribbon domain-containing protein [Desulfobacterium sp.]